MRRSIQGRILHFGLLVAPLGLGSCSETEPTNEAPRVPTKPVIVEKQESSEQTTRTRVKAGRFYVPTYSHIYTDEGVADDLAITLSIRNVSTQRSLSLSSVRYYDTAGKLIEEFLDLEAVLAPLGTVEYFVRTRDRRGGSGANFIVDWHADAPVLPPLTEAVMVRLSGTQAYAFTTRGVEIAVDTALPQEQSPPDPDAGDAKPRISSLP